jgi:predicted glutamate--cysteine ligase
MEQQLQLGHMQNVRHLWTSVRPNGDNRPHDLNRLEIRICDLIADPLVLLAVTAFAELRIQQLLLDPQRHDPLRASRLDAQALAELADANDRAAARSSLEAPLRHWRSGGTITARAWMAEALAELAPLAQACGLGHWLAPLQGVLEQGNQAMQWLAAHRAGTAVAPLIAASAAAMAQRDDQLNAELATERLRPLG